MEFSGKYYACLALLEDETAKLYEKLINRCEKDLAKLLLLNILYETKKHKELLVYIANLKGCVYPPITEECGKEAGSLIKDSLEDVRILKLQFEQSQSIIDVLRHLINFEKSISEEYLIMIHGGVLKHSEDNPAVREVLKYVAEDEERHINLLNLACKLLK